MPGRISRIGWKSWHDAQFDQPLITGRIGWKSIEITLYACLVESVEFGGNPLRLCLVKLGGRIGGWIGRKSIEIMPSWIGWPWRSNWVEIHWDYAWSNQLNFYPIWPAINAWSNRSNWVVKLGGNPLRLCLVESVEFGGQIGWKSIEIMPGRISQIWWSNWVEIHWDDAWSDRLNFYPIWPAINTWSNWVVELVVELGGNSLRLCLVESVKFSGQIGWKSIEIMPSRIGRIWWLNWVEIHWAYIVCLPGRIGRIWWSNWEEIHWDYAWSNWSNLVVELGGNPLRLCLVELVEFGGWIGWKSIEIMPGWIGQIWWLNWVEIHWDYIVCLPVKGSRCRLNSTIWPGSCRPITPIRPGIISMDFHPILIWPGIISMDFHPIRPGIISMKNKYKVAQYIWSRFDQQIDWFY